MEEEGPSESPSPTMSLIDDEEVVVVADLHISLPRSLSIPSPFVRPIHCSTSRRSVLLADPTKTEDDTCEEVVEVGFERRILEVKGRIERLECGGAEESTRCASAREDAGAGEESKDDVVEVVVAELHVDKKGDELVGDGRRVGVEEEEEDRCETRRCSVERAEAGDETPRPGRNRVSFRESVVDEEDEEVDAKVGALEDGIPNAVDDENLPEGLLELGLDLDRPANSSSSSPMVDVRDRWQTRTSLVVSSPPIST